MAKKEKHKTTHPKIGKYQRWCAFEEHMLKLQNSFALASFYVTTCENGVG